MVQHGRQTPTLFVPLRHTCPLQKMHLNVVLRWGGMPISLTCTCTVLPGEVDQLISQFGSSVRIGGGPSSSLEGARRQAELQMARNRVADAQAHIARHNDSKAVFFRQMLHVAGPQRVSELGWLTVPHHFRSP